LDENHDTALELNDVYQVNEKPDQPGKQTGDVKPKYWQPPPHGNNGMSPLLK